MALLTRFDMPRDWYFMSVQQVGNWVLGAPCDPPVVMTPPFVVSATDGFQRKVDSRDFTATVVQSIYEFAPGDAAKLLDLYRTNTTTKCTTSLGNASFNIERLDPPAIADEGLAIRYVNAHATCGAIVDELVLVRAGDDVIRVESNDACDGTVSTLAQTVASGLLTRLQEARHRYELSLAATPESTTYEGLSIALLSLDDLPLGWSEGLRGERELTGYAFCGDKVERGRSLASTMVTFHKLAPAIGSNPGDQLNGLAEAPEVAEEVAFLRDGSVDAYVADWLDSAEACARYYTNTPRLQDSLARLSLPSAGDGAIVYQQSGFFDSSVKVLLRRGRFVMQVEVRARKPGEPDRALIEEVVRRAEEKLAQNEPGLLREFE